MNAAGSGSTLTQAAWYSDRFTVRYFRNGGGVLITSRQITGTSAALRGTSKRRPPQLRCRCYDLVPVPDKDHHFEGRTSQGRIE